MYSQYCCPQHCFNCWTHLLCIANIAVHSPALTAEHTVYSQYCCPQHCFNLLCIANIAVHSYMTLEGGGGGEGETSCACPDWWCWAAVGCNPTCWPQIIISPALANCTSWALGQCNQHSAFGAVQPTLSLLGRATLSLWGSATLSLLGRATLSLWGRATLSLWGSATLSLFKQCNTQLGNHLLVLLLRLL